MTPDAKKRMEVYREGQRAFNSGKECPYVDWRASTWLKGKQAAEHYWQLLYTEMKEEQND